MSFSDLVSGGASCGPSNPLQNLGKRFGQDRSNQFDRMAGEASGRAMGPSFRQRGPEAGPSSQAQPDFFKPSAQHLGPAPDHAFDMGGLHGSLPFQPGPNGGASGAQMAFPGPSQHAEHPADFESSFRHSPGPMQQQQAPGNSAWAQEYRNAGPAIAPARTDSPQFQNQSHAHQQPVGFQPRYMNAGLMGMGSMRQAGYAPSHGFHAGMAQGRVDSAVSQADASQWDTAFTTWDEQAKAASKGAEPDPTLAFTTYEAKMTDAQPVAQQEQRPVNPQDADELAKTAGRLVSQVEHETNTKFKQSNFLNLMRKIRDRQAGIQGTDIVETPEAAMGGVEATSALNKGKGRDLSGSAPLAQTQNEEYHQARTLPAKVQSSPYDSLLRPREAQSPIAQAMAGQNMTREAEDQARRELDDFWAEEDARSEAIEKKAMEQSKRAFLGDGGDVAARMREDDAEAAEFARYQRLGANIGGASASMARWEERILDDDAQAQRDKDEAAIDDWSKEDFVGRKWQGAAGRGLRGAQEAEWDKLQADWDEWQAGPSGMERAQQLKAPPASAAQAPAYVFQQGNPYVGTTRQHANHAAAELPLDMRSVLEREAEVQADPTNASAWLDLGIKQQENEREMLAIAALHRAIQLDPTLRDAWLALAVSYTNENDRTAALEATERWMSSSEQYAAVIAAHRAEVGSERKSAASMMPAERHQDVIGALIAIARDGSMRGEVDADVQVALGVLFNASEEYDKAVDCFSAALSARPDDWILYNRLGATLSNSGRSSEAISYYHHALNLRPDFARCHFNLSISCLNLRMYRDAASHTYTALTLQASDEAAQQSLGADSQQGSPAGVTSNSLWETLRVACELMDRPDLAQLCMARDIHAFGPDAHAAFFGHPEDKEGEALEPTM